MRTLGGREQGDQVGLFLWVKVVPYIKRTESILPVAPIQVLKLNHPNMSMLWVHGDWFKRNKRKKERSKKQGI